jgi:chemotaxis family two-component system response regulator Rcp1
VKPGAHRILLIEDNPGDVRLIQESLRMHAVDYSLIHLEKADDAVRAVGGYGPDGAEVPDLILLDYNLPRGDAGDVLTAASKNPALAGIPKAVVTSSLAPKDRAEALRLGADCFINKPADLDGFLTEVGGTIAALLRARRA